MIGMWRSSGCALIRRVASQPSITGIPKSMRIRSGRSSLGPGDALGAVRGDDHRVEVLEDLDEQVPIELLVLDDEDASCGLIDGTGERLGTLETRAA